MAFLSYSEDFDLDDDGILRDSSESGGILIDDDGIVRDDFDLLSKHGSSTHWTDSGLGGDKASSTPSTLRQLDLQSYPSFEDVSRNFDESNVNISDLEASKDDLSFDADFDDTQDNERGIYGLQDRSGHITHGNRSGLSSRSSFDHSLNYDEDLDDEKKHSNQKDLFGEEYYRQLQELGVLVDENDFNEPRDSLQEFENLETSFGDRNKGSDPRDDKLGNEIEDFLRHDARTPNHDSMDIEGPEHVVPDLRQGYMYESGGFDQFDPRELVNEGGKRTRPNTASSTRTISSRSFPEISPEEALELYTERLQSVDDQDSLSIQFDQSQKTDQNGDDVDDDDEIFFVQSQSQSQDNDADSPTPAKVPAYDNENKPSMTLKSKSRNFNRSGRSSSERSRSVTPQGQLTPQRSRSVTPQADNYVDHYDNHVNDTRDDSLTQVTRLDSRNKTYSDSEGFRPESALSEHSSVTSETRSARPKSSKPPKKGPTQKGSLPHARSEESFFDIMQDDGSPSKKSDKGPKRLLPKPSGGEVNSSFKVKSKSTTNIAALGPVKPTHMSLSEIRNINIDDDFELHDISEPKSSSDVPKGELTKKLKQESTKRQHATQLVQQLQSDYDRLLSKYALAELTIDQMRLGAKITLHANSPTPSQATSGSLQSAQHLQMLQLSGAQRGISAPSPQQGSVQNVFFPPDTAGGHDLTNPMQQRGTSPALLPRSDSTNSMDSTSTPRGDVEQPGGIANDAEKVKLGLMFQARNLDDQMQSFQTLLGESQLNIDEQEQVFDRIRGDHEKLRRDYLQSKEDYNVLRRSTAAGSEANFDQEKELEGELFKLGMKFDEIHEKVEENLKEKSAQRQPFQKKRRDSQGSTADSLEPDPATDNVKKKIHGSAGDDMLHPKPNPELDDKLQRLHENYNALLDRYRRLKQMAQSPERDKEIDNLVRKLRKICNDEPTIFRLPPDIQDRVDQLADNQQKKSDKPSTSAAAPGQLSTSSRKLPQDPSQTNAGLKQPQDPSNTNTDTKQPVSALATKSPAKSYEIMGASETWSLADSIDRWERTKDDGNLNRSQRSRSQNDLNVSRGSVTFKDDDRDGDVPDGRGSRNLRQKDRSGSYSSLSSRGRHSPDSTFNDRGSPCPSLPRPRRHDYPDRERRERRDMSLKKRPEGGSTTSLPDSGISEHEGGAAGGQSGASSPLSKLPGPGKFKQMTGRREADTDSGFIGSMVGSEVSAGNLSSRRPPQQSPLRLHHPGDAGGQRPSSRQSVRSDDSARPATPQSARSAHSIASSKSSRRTPTKAFPLPDREQVNTSTRAKTPTKEGRSRSRDQASQPSREYTDDSYTTVTESEMSFESDMRPRRGSRGSGSRRGSQRQIEKIAEDTEEDQFSVDPSLNETTDLNFSWLTSSSEQQSKHSGSQQAVKSKKQEPTATGSKVASRSGQGQQRNDQGQRSKGQRRGRITTDEDTTPTMSPTRTDATRDYTVDTTQDTYTSDETTPRSVIERERKAARQKSGSQNNIMSQEPSTEPPQRVMTPVKRSEVHPKKLYRHQTERGPVLKSNQPRLTQEVLVDRGLHLNADETILASDAETAATATSRQSANSERIKLLSDEIGKLREDFLRANQEKQQQAPPPPAPLPPQTQYPDHDQYFDPTEDIYAFMRGPRRRANSFSGHGGRDWDYDWTLPNVNRDGDIPLGYAAAESYATPAPGQQKQRTDPTSTTQDRGRHRLRKRIKQRNSSTQHYGEQNGYDSDQSPTRQPTEEVATSTARLQGHYGHYSPQKVQTQQTGPPKIPPPGYQAQSKSGHRVYGSQPNLAFSGYQPPPRSVASGSTEGSSQSGTRPLRQNLYSYAANPSQTRPQSYHEEYYNQGPGMRRYASDDILVNDGQTRFIPNRDVDARSLQSEGVSTHHGVYTNTCPLCGSQSTHTHGEYMFPPPDTRVPVGYLVQNGRDIVETVQLPVYAIPETPQPSPVSNSHLPFRTYLTRSQSTLVRNPPQLKPQLLPFQIPKRVSFAPPTQSVAPPTISSLTPPTKPEPIIASHDAISQPIIIQLAQESPMDERSRPRARSKSAGRTGRIRHYSPDGRMRSRYFVREFGNQESESAESETEELPRTRSRSVGRQSRKLRHARKYRRVRAENDSDSDETGHGLSAAAEADLNRSLRLVEQIDGLTHKMMNTVGSELSKTKRMKEFGSSFW